MDIEAKLKSIVAPNGTNLYEHFLNTIGKLVQDHPENAYDAFEEFSHFVKSSGYKYDDTTNYRDSNRLREGWEDLGPFLNKMKDYFVSISILKSQIFNPINLPYQWLTKSRDTFRSKVRRMKKLRRVTQSDMFQT